MVAALVIAIIIYVVVMFECYKQKSFIFKPYVQTVPKDACLPLIDVTPLTADEKQARAAILAKAKAKN